MRVGAILSLASALLSFLVGLPEHRSELRGDPTLGDGEISLALWLTFTLTIAFALIGVVLWLWMAATNGRGRPWARVLATVFFAIYTLSTIGLVWTPRGEPVSEVVVGVAIWLVGLAAVLLMWRRDSTVYYHSTAAQRASR